jgi:glycosyltransferase involved in cell wall biosynthesis
MKILMVASYLPYPLYSGGHIRLYNLIKNLSLRHDITLICEKRDSQTKEDVLEVEKICKKVITVRRKKQWSFSNILKTGFSTNPFLITGHTSEEMQILIKDEMVRQKFDLIHVETFYVYQNLPARNVMQSVAGGPKVSIPIVLAEHNIEYLVYQRYAKLANPILKPLLYADVMKIKRKEQETWKKADKLVAVSNIEKTGMMREDVVVVPNGVDTQSFNFRSFDKIPKEKRILYIGDFKWIQNKDALEFILKEIWPKILEKLSSLNKEVDLKLWIVGRNIPQNLKDLAKGENIIIDEDNKDETPAIFAKSYILLAPFRIAGGTSYKVLESFASGVAVVTTNLGVMGLEAKPNISVLVAQESEDLANHVCDLLTDASLYKKLTLNARKFVEENYDWKEITKKLEEVYISVF